MECDVIVVGGGPVGLMLAGELRLGGAEVVVLERLAARTGESRGVGFTRRAAEVFQQRGLLERLGEIQYGTQGHYGGIRIDFGMLPDSHFGVRGVAQNRVEEMLENWVGELGATVLRSREVVDYREHADRVVVAEDGPQGRTQHVAKYVVGCDGASSVIRRLAGIDFPGWEATKGAYVADVVDSGIELRNIGERLPNGMVLAMGLEDGVTRIVIHEDGLPPRDSSLPLTFTEVADSWQRVTGQSIHHAEVRWISSFTDASRQAAEYRRGRVFLAGDSTHIHIPAGAQGLSIGVQDAANLGWKLAAAVRGWGSEELLDSYHAERHPVGQRLLRNTRAQSLLYLTGDEMEPMRSVMRELAAIPEAARSLAGMVSGLSVRYDVADVDHPLLGIRMPHQELRLRDGSRTSVAELLHPARGLLLTSKEPDVSWSHPKFAARIDVRRVTEVPRHPDHPTWAVDSVLVRPDGYIAWVAPDGGDVRRVLARWFGLPELSGKHRVPEPASS